MNDHDLRHLLETIEREIKRTQTDDEKGRELLQHIEADIHAFRERPESEWLEPEDTFVERMNDAVDHFEMSHPTLTSMISQMLNILNNAGI